jgi:hypothetical protein
MTGALGVSTSSAGTDSFYVDGTYGRLFTVTDDLTDAVFSVNTISGLPIIEAYSDYSVKMGRYGQNDFYINPNGNIGFGTASPAYKVDVTGSLRVSANIYVGGYIEPDGQSMNLRKVNSITFAPNNTWNDPYHHGIMSTDLSAANSDAISINSWNDITLRIDSNGNNSASYVRFMNDTTGSNQFAYIGYDGSNYIASFNGNVFAGSSFRAPIFYDSVDTNFYGDFASTSVVNAIRFGNSSNNGTLSAPDDWGMRLTTDAGYIQFGPANSSYAHIYTDRDTFYFNKDLLVNGNTVLTTATYNSYSPTLTGGGASGTWSINITGSAGSATTATTAGALTSMNISQFTNNSGYITGISFANVSAKPTTISGYGITDAITTSNIGSQSVSVAASATQVVTLQDDAPAGVNGKLWWETDTGKLKVYYGATSAWIDALPMPDVTLFYTKAGGAITGDVSIQQSLTVTGNILTSGTVTATGGNSTNWNTAFGWGNHGAQGYATQSYVNTAVSNLVDAAPGTLDTLNELAAALGDDPNFATTIATSIGTKQAQLNGTGFVKVSGTTVSYDNSTYLTSITSANVTTALGYTPYNSTNPNGYITGISFANVSAKPTTISGYGITDAITTGNIGSQSVSYATSAGNADTVDSLHASSFVRNDTTRQYLKPYFEYGEWLTTQSPLDLVNQMGGGGFRVDFLHPSYTANGNWGHVMTWSGYNGYTMYQMSGSYGAEADVELYVRNEANHERNAWSSWRRLLHDNNYNSYAPTLTGTGASGTWSINITGSAGSVAWTNVSGRPTAVSSFTNDAGYLTALPSHNHDDRYYTETESDTRYVNTSGDTMSGNLTLSGYTNPHITLTAASGDYSYLELYDGSTYGYIIKNVTSSTANGVLAGSLYLYTDNSKATQIVHGGVSNAAFLSGGDVYIRGQVYVGGNGASTGTQLVYNSGTWGINVTGTAARATRANGNFYIDDNYGNSIVGLYSSTILQGVFAMGDAYKLTAGGGAGNLYGLAWSHPNAGGVASNLNTHGLLVMENGTFLAAISGSIRARDDMRAPIFYDSDDANYYGNFASTSRFSRLLVQQSGVNSTAGPALRVSKGWDNGTPDIIYDTVVIESNDVTSIRIKESDGGTAGWSTGDGYTSFTANTPMRFYTAGSTNSYIYSGMGGTLAMYIDQSQRIGMGTAAPTSRLHVVGNTAGADVFAVDGINGRLFTVSDDLSDSLFSVNTIAGLPVIEAFANNTVVIGKYGLSTTFSNDGSITTPGSLTTGGTITTPSHGNSSQWNTAYNKRPTAVAFSGTSTKTLTLTLGDGSTLTAAFNDIDTDTNTDGQTLSISGSTLTISGGNSISLPSGGISQATADTLYVSVNNNTSLNNDSRNRRGVTRLYRYDDDSDFSVQHYWTGSYWHLRGFNGDTFHADVQVGYADSAGSATSATTAGSAPNAGNLNASYGVTAGAGNGLKFWGGSDTYKIHMGNSAEYHYGPVTDYSIKTNIDSVGATRGFTWGQNGVTPIAALNVGNGNMQIAGTFTAIGTITGSNLSGTNTGDQTNISGNAATATNADAVDGFHATNAASGLAYYASNGYLNVPSWINVGTTGIFSGTNNAHLRPNTGSYGAWEMIGSKNGWSGIFFNDSGDYLMANNNEVGHYQNGIGWKFRWYGGEMYISSGSTGGGTERTVIHSGNIGGQSVSYAATAGSAPNAGNANDFYNVNAGNGNGLRFWNSDSYKISMGVGDLYQYGPVTDYSIKTQMNDADATRGFTWGRLSHAPIAALNSTSGDMRIAGTFTASNFSGTSSGTNTGDQTNISGNAATATSATQVVTIQDAAPGGAAGKLWWESDTGKLKVYYNSAWVDATPVPDMSIYYAKAGGAITGDVTIQQTLTVVGNTLIQGTLTETSDISLKENILPLENSLAKVMKLNGVSFNKKATPTVKEIGFIAQEVEAVIPDLVTETNEGIKTVSYSRVAAVLVETIKEQQAQIDALTDMVNLLTKKLDDL